MNSNESSNENSGLWSRIKNFALISKDAYKKEKVNLPSGVAPDPVLAQQVIGQIKGSENWDIDDAGRIVTESGVVAAIYKDGEGIPVLAFPGTGAVKNNGEGQTAKHIESDVELFLRSESGQSLVNNTLGKGGEFAEFAIPDFQDGFKEEMNADARLPIKALDEGKDIAEALYKLNPGAKVTGHSLGSSIANYAANAINNDSKNTHKMEAILFSNPGVPNRVPHSNDSQFITNVFANSDVISGGVNGNVRSGENSIPLNSTLGGGFGHKLDYVIAEVDRICGMGSSGKALSSQEIETLKKGLVAQKQALKDSLAVENKQTKKIGSP